MLKSNDFSILDDRNIFFFIKLKSFVIELNSLELISTLELLIFYEKI